MRRRAFCCLGIFVCPTGDPPGRRLCSTVPVTIPLRVADAPFVLVLQMLRCFPGRWCGCRIQPPRDCNFMPGCHSGRVGGFSDVRLVALGPISGGLVVTAGLARVELGSESRQEFRGSSGSGFGSSGSYGPRALGAAGNTVFTITGSFITDPARSGQSATLNLQLWAPLLRTQRARGSRKVSRKSSRRSPY